MGSEEREGVRSDKRKIEEWGERRKRDNDSICHEDVLKALEKIENV